MAIVFTNTNLAAAGGVVAAMLMTQVLYKKVDLTMALNGAWPVWCPSLRDRI